LPEGTKKNEERIMKEKFKIVGIIALAAIFALSFVSCDLETDPCEDGHTWGNFAQIGETAEADRACTECGETELLAMKHFEGKWVTTTNSNTIEISATGNLKVYNETSATTNNWTLTNATWAAEASQYSSISNYNTIKTNYPVGFRLTGGTVGGTTTNNWSENTTGTASVYINATGDKIVVRLTDAYLTSPTIREFTKQAAAAE